MGENSAFLEAAVALAGYQWGYIFLELWEISELRSFYQFFFWDERGEFLVLGLDPAVVETIFIVWFRGLELVVNQFWRCQSGFRLLKLVGAGEPTVQIRLHLVGEI